MNATNPHSPANFNPAEYSVVDYLDNKRPQYRGQPIECWQAEIKQWEESIAFYFPLWRDAGRNPSHNIHRCHHCGNGNVRYISVVEHTPTRELLVFGSDCVHRLAFANRDELKLAQIKARAEQGHARLKVWNARVAFLAERADLASLIASNPMEKPVHKDNTFAQDILRQLDQFGRLSDRQVECLFQSLQKDVTRAAELEQREAKKQALTAAGVQAPVGRLSVEGTVLHTRTQDGPYGVVHKMLVELTTGAKVWTTIPSSCTEDVKGKRVQFTATFEQSKDDALFSFGKRPSKFSILS